MAVTELADISRRMEILESALVRPQRNSNAKLALLAAAVFLLSMILAYTVKDEINSRKTYSLLSEAYEQGE